MPVKKNRRRQTAGELEHEDSLVGDANGKSRKGLMDAFAPEDIHDYLCDRHTFTIFVGPDPRNEAITFDDTSLGEPGVDCWMSERFEKNLHMLSGINHEAPILIKMGSCGGHWVEGMQMFSAIATCPNPVTVLATRDARSMTSLIPLAADRFLIRPPGKYMIHRGGYVFIGLDQEADTADRERRICNEMMMQLYVARLREQGAHKKLTDSAIRAMLDSKLRHDIDVWWTADEAKDMGFIDGVFTGNWRTLRAKEKNVERRRRMLSVVRANYRSRVEKSSK